MGFCEGYMIHKCGCEYKCDLDMKEGIESGKANVSEQGREGGKIKTPCEQTSYIKVGRSLLVILGAKCESLCRLESSRNLGRIKTVDH